MLYSVNEVFNCLTARRGGDIFPSAFVKQCKGKGGRYDKKRTAAALKRIKDGMCAYEPAVAFSADRYDSVGLYKFTRPWDVVDKLKRFTVPEGDFSVGVEVEYGFVNTAAASCVITFVRNWRHVTCDREGGAHGVETTFPPTLYSKLNRKSQVFRYVKFLQEHQHLLANHWGQVGTHINVGYGGLCDSARLMAVNGHLMHLSSELKVKYFGRHPYGYGYRRGSFGNHWVEWKLFNSTPDPEAVERYINIAVSLTKLLRDGAPINDQSVAAALEAGYNGRVK